MKPKRWLALAAAFLGCAVAYGIHVLGKHDAAPSAAVDSAKSKAAATERSRSPFKPGAGSTSERRLHSGGRQEGGVPSQALRSTQPRKIAGSPDFTGGKIQSESQWREHAARVETEANQELKRLTDLLDLDSLQQDQVFSSLAQQSRYWLPGMQAGSGVSAGNSRSSGESVALAGGNNQARTVGNPTTEASSGTSALVAGGQTVANLISPAGSPQPAVVDLTAYLNADQQQTLVEEEMDRQAWWAEILPQLLPPTISDGTTAVTSDAGNTISDPAPETKEFDGGDVLLEE